MSGFDVAWIHGSPSAKHDTNAEIQVHHYDEATVLLRQNMAIDYEAPFMFLLFGTAQAVLIDTGATPSPDHFPLRRVVDQLVDTWLGRHPHDDYRLLVLHTHGHGDHIAGDAQFSDRPHTKVVDAELDNVLRWFDFGADGDGVARVDLGGRVLECLATPGHHPAAVTFYDSATGLLFTGDTVYPGRLHVQDWAAFTRSIDRLLDFCAHRPVTHVVGCHIEMTTQPGVDYPVRTTYQPDEPPLQMTVSQLRAVRAAITSVADHPGWHRFPEFLLYRPTP